MTLQLALKVTGVELGLITDPNIYLMIESGIRGSLSYVAQRHAAANFPEMANYCPDQPMSHLLYLDCDSLYTTFQTYPLPVDGFRFLSDPELATFDVASVPNDSETGYFVECDLRYPSHLHALHNAYPLAPEHVIISTDHLSDTQHFMLDKTNTKHLPCK